LELRAPQSLGLWLHLVTACLPRTSYRRPGWSEE